MICAFGQQKEKFAHDDGPHLGTSKLGFGFQGEADRADGNETAERMGHATPSAKEKEKDEPHPGGQKLDMWPAESR